MILHDEGSDLSAENLNAVIKAAGGKVPRDELDSAGGLLVEHPSCWSSHGNTAKVWALCTRVSELQIHILPQHHLLSAQATKPQLRSVTKQFRLALLLRLTGVRWSFR